MATSILLSPPSSQSSFTYNSYPSSSASSMSSLNTSAASLPHSNRRIHFAPLPDLRRPDDNEHIPILQIEDSESKRTSYTYDDSSSSSCSPSDSERPPSPQLYCPSSRPTTQQMLAHHPKAPGLHWSKPKSLSLLPFPFKKLSPPSSSTSSFNSLTPTPSLDSNPTPTHSRVVSTENVPTHGTINMFRPSSKNNDSTPSPSSWGFGLTRWSSPSTPKNGSPLARSQSVPTNATSVSSTPKKSTTIPSYSTKPRHNSTSSTSSAGSTKLNPRKGLRMLNGRVYGGPKHRHPGVGANPFANARDDDNEFIEWGYGGMGSVRGAQSAGVAGRADDKGRTKWERVQHNGRNVMAGKSSTEKGDVDEEDDGSGMGWVKKRKAARERKEKEEKERAEAEAAQNGQPQVESPVSEVATPPTSSHVRQPSSSSVTPRPSTPAEEDTPAPEHIYTAVTLPAHLSRHHRRVQSRSPSMDTVPSIATIVPDREEVPASIESDSETESEDDSTRRAEDDYGDDEDDYEDEGEEGRRKTALGAGIEKISRHN